MRVLAGGLPAPPNFFVHAAYGSAHPRPHQADTPAAATNHPGAGTTLHYRSELKRPPPPPESPAARTVAAAPLPAAAHAGNESIAEPRGPQSGPAGALGFEMPAFFGACMLIALSLVLRRMTAPRRRSFVPRRRCRRRQVSLRPSVVPRPVFS